MHHFEAPPRIAAQPGEEQSSLPPVFRGSEEELQLEEVESCGSSVARWPGADEASEPAAELTPVAQAGPLLRAPLTGSEKESQEDDALQETTSQNGLDELLPDLDVDNTISFAEKKELGSQAAITPTKVCEAGENQETLFAKPPSKVEEVKELPPAILMSLAPMPGVKTPVEAKLKEPDFVAESKPTEVSSLARKDLAADDIRAIVKAEVASELASVFDRIDSLKKSCDALAEELSRMKGSAAEELDKLRARICEAPAAAKHSTEDVEELQRSVKKELFDVQQVFNSELKDLSVLLEDRDAKFEALESADAQIQRELQAVRDDTALQTATLTDEVIPTLTRLTSAQRAWDTAQKEVEARLNDCFARQKSDALFLNGRLKDMEAGWTGVLGCFCKRRRPKEVAFRPSEFSAKGTQPQPQSIPGDPEHSVTLDAD